MDRPLVIDEEITRRGRQLQSPAENGGHLSPAHGQIRAEQITAVSRATSVHDPGGGNTLDTGPVRTAPDIDERVRRGKRCRTAGHPLLRIVGHGTVAQKGFQTGDQSDLRPAELQRIGGNTDPVRVEVPVLHRVSEHQLGRARA